MIGLSIILNQQKPAFPELDPENCHHIANDAPPIVVAVIDGGMKSGLPSVAIRIDLPDGKTVIAETSARLFVTAGRAIDARFPKLFDGN